MSFLNLGLGELLGLAGAISAGVVALYLLDRSKRKQVVSTLRFWAGAGVRTQLKHRRRIQQPWSLLLEIISLLLLLLAIAGPRFGIIGGPGRDHVLILDTSAVMGELPESRGRQSTLLDEARDSARAYLRSLPRRDRVMLVRADALATPATAFESDFSVVEEAIRTSRPGSSALNLEQAFEFAQQAQRLQSERAGEIVYAGAGRVSEQQADLTNLPTNLRVLTTGAPQENVGLRKIGLRRSATVPDTWDIFVAVRNYGSKPHAVDLELQFGKSPVGEKRLQLAPDSEQQATFSYRTNIGGYLEARLNITDAFARDDRALIELPAQASLHILVYSKDPQLLRPLIASNPQVDAVFEDPSKYDPAAKADVVVLDRFAPAMPHADSIWIEPPADGSPIPVRETKSGVRLERWNAESALGAGLRTQEVILESAEVFTPAQGDEVVAESAAGPLVVARDVKGAKLAVLGFHPGRASMKYQIATPLLTANILKWMAPEIFRGRDVQAGTVGTVSIPVGKDVEPATIKVLDEDQRPLPFTIKDGALQFFSGAPGAVSVVTGDRETVYSLTLPDVAEAAWRVPANVRRGVPRVTELESPPQDFWPWLAVLGGLGLLLDWLLFGRSRLFRLRPGRATPAPTRIRQRKAS